MFYLESVGHALRAVKMHVLKKPNTEQSMQRVKNAKGDSGCSIGDGNLLGDIGKRIADNRRILDLQFHWVSVEQYEAVMCEWMLAKKEDQRMGMPCSRCLESRSVVLARLLWDGISLLYCVICRDCVKDLEHMYSSMWHQDVWVVYNFEQKQFEAKNDEDRRIIHWVKQRFANQRG